MICRLKRDLVRQRLATRAAVVLLGPRQVGKTTLAQDIAAQTEAVYIDLEHVPDKEKLIDPVFYFKQYQGKLIIIDEVQRMPELFSQLRSQIDQNRREGHEFGQFLLLGSASNDLLKQSSESLAGRVSYQELFPLNLQEVGAENLEKLWLRGGFPESYLSDLDSFTWQSDFIRTYLERDIPALGARIPAETLRRFWTMLAHRQGQAFNASQIGGSLGVSPPAASRYLDLMVDLMLVRRLTPWFANVGKRLVKQPKTYVRDSGILHSLLNIQTFDGLLSHPISGASWEGFVIENILSVIPPQFGAHFYRTSAGAEIDLVLNTGTKLWAIEIKRNMAPKLSKGFYNACEDIKPYHKRVVYPGDEVYKLPGDVVVTPLAELMEELRYG